MNEIYNASSNFDGRNPSERTSKGLLAFLWPGRAHGRRSSRFNIGGCFLFNISQHVVLHLNMTSTQHSVGRRISLASHRMGRTFNIPTIALMVEIAVRSFFKICVTHPKSAKPGDHPSHNVMVVLGRNKTSMAWNFESFTYPRLPYPFRPLYIDYSVNQSTSVIYPDDDPPLPNHYCPSWLHDINVVMSHHPSSRRRPEEPRFCRSWHPIVDPVFWSSFRHENGSFSGGYLPRFGYIAYHIADRTSPTGQQMESHQGC